MRTPEGKEKIQTICASMPEQPWHIDVHRHASAIETHFGKYLPVAFPPPKARKAKAYLQQDTWQVRNQRAWLRKRVHKETHRCECFTVGVLPHLEVRRRSKLSQLIQQSELSRTLSVTRYNAYVTSPEAMLFQSLVSTVLFHGAGTWTYVEVPEIWALAHWEGSWLALVRASVHWLWEQVDQELERPSAEVLDCLSLLEFDDLDLHKEPDEAWERIRPVDFHPLSPAMDS
ncbi:hypothetical protein AK812_SmicGene23225 [Symbiodinium microadriaticum]|uniref:Uncharacterized protein n=1 Tax=Symbiodinium microadriaticum TaxID=2951 RepID=A0A1Q9DI14_SYMMI|nr:hypothetical protein AK812_SmicGene23225 [Symbiodinium microadriaticum]